MAQIAELVQKTVYLYSWRILTRSSDQPMRHTQHRYLYRPSAERLPRWMRRLWVWF